MRLVMGHTLQAGMAVPDALASALDEAVVTGRAEAAGWARIHPTGSTDRFHRDTFASIEPFPTGAAQDAELALIHEAIATRTERGNDRALELAHRAGWDTWERAIANIGRTQGVDQARLAAQLVQVAAARTDAVSTQAKQSFNRSRPYDVDPTISTVVPLPHGNASHPSGHASGAYAAAVVLAAFEPHRADELLDVAAQVAYSRIYGGVHFQSDVVVGARIAARIAADVLRRAGM